MKNFGFEFNRKYIVVLNGNVVKKSFLSKDPARRWCVRYSVNRNNYVELWYQSIDGSAILLEYWN